MQKINVEKYNPQWQVEFERAKLFYEKLLVGIDKRIEYVGSTSVIGLWAKPVLDIDIIVKNSDDSLQVITKLSSVGYKHAVI